MAIYSIFQVYDYKGGELSKRLNLSEKSYYNELLDVLNLFDHLMMSNWELRNEEEDLYGKDIDDEEISIDLLEVYKSDILLKIEESISIYAGAGHHVIEVFIINEERELEELDIIEEAWKAIEWYYNNRNNE
jgi:hypothetical protein